MDSQNDTSQSHGSNQPTRPLNILLSIPKPVFIRLLCLFGGGLGCLFVGSIVAWVTRDTVTFGMSLIICIALIIAGISLKIKISKGNLYSISGVCISSTAKILGRYKRNILVIIETGEEVAITLPKKIEFKIGYRYTCYFSNPITNRQTENPVGGFSYADMDFPTNGFLGCEDFGLYSDKPAIEPK